MACMTHRWPCRHLGWTVGRLLCPFAMECGSLLPLSRLSSLPRQEASLLQGKAAASRRTPQACALILRGWPWAMTVSRLFGIQYSGVGRIAPGHAEARHET
ncbi:MAG: hypothetical protein EA347_01475 [Thioalkalivibrio sp.]|nr:MAG: hypothetical protein EA347_01475 [Thioalkalivibrio sp.]